MCKKTAVYWQFVRYLFKELVKNRTALPRIGLVYTNSVEHNTLTYHFVIFISEFSQILGSCILSTSASFQGAAGGHIYTSSYVFVLGAQTNDTTFYKTAYCSIRDL
jgi:hypothetical protein